MESKGCVKRERNGKSKQNGVSKPLVHMPGKGGHQQKGPQYKPACLSVLVKVVGREPDEPESTSNQ